MVARKPFTQSSIEERKCWPETRAALHGPEDYEKCGILSNKQRAELIQLARVAPEQAKPFIDEVTCVINGYRHRKRANAQESPAAVAASMQLLIDALEQVVKVGNAMPLYVVKEVLDEVGITGWRADGLRAAKEKVRQLEAKMIGHRPSSITHQLLFHAQTLQQVAGAFSSHLADDWNEMQRWLGEALVASGERRPSKNFKKGYFDKLMLPQTVKGGVDLPPRGLASGAPSKGG